MGRTSATAIPAERVDKDLVNDHAQDGEDAVKTDHGFLETNPEAHANQPPLGQEVGISGGRRRFELGK
jgi:hypothetical protein